MTDLVVGSADSLDPESIAIRTFGQARKGFDQREVRHFLDRVAEAVRTSQARVARLEARIVELEGRLTARVIDLDEDELMVKLGEETTRVLRSAREAAAELYARAEERAQSLRQAAHDESTQVRQEAAAWAEQTRRSAETESSDVRRAAAREALHEMERAKEIGRSMIDEAKSVRERVIAELQRRRDLAAEQIAQLLRERQALRSSLDSVSRLFDDIGAQLDDSAFVMPPLAELAPEPTGSRRRRELTEPTTPETEASAIGRVRDGADADRDTERTEVGAAAADEAVAAAEVGTAEVVAEEVAAAEVAVATPPLGTPVIEADTHRDGPEAPLDESVEVVQEVEFVEEIVVVEEAGLVEDAGLAEDAGLVEEELEPGERESADVAMPRSGEAGVDTDHSQFDLEPGADGESEGEADRGPDDRRRREVRHVAGASHSADVIDAIFARIKADRQEDRRAAGHDTAAPAPQQPATPAAPSGPAREAVASLLPRAPRSGSDVEGDGAAVMSFTTGAALGSVTPRLPADFDDGRWHGDEFDEFDDDDGEGDSDPDTGQVAVTAEPATVVNLSAWRSPEVVGDRAKLARDDAIAAVGDSLVRRMKRVLQDEQNSVLEAIGRVRRPNDWAGVLPNSERLRSKFADEPVAGLVEAAAAGWQAGAGSDLGGEPTDVPLADLAELIASHVLDPLAVQLGRIRPADLDVDAVNDAVGAAFREARSMRVEPVVLSAVSAAYCRGVYVATPEGARFRWVVDHGGAPSPDCDDNALSNPVARGTSFPTGHLYPPVHERCRCLVVPVPAE